MIRRSLTKSGHWRRVVWFALLGSACLVGCGGGGGADGDQFGEDAKAKAAAELEAESAAMENMDAYAPDSKGSR